MALELDDIKKDKLMLSDRKVRTWNYMQNGDHKNGSEVYAEVYYGKKGRKLQFSVSDVYTNTGIRPTVSKKRGYMAISLKKEVSKLIRQAVGQPLLELVFNNRVEMMPKKGSKFKEISHISFLWKGIVTEGEDKGDGSGETWNDSIICNVPMKRKGQQPIVDSNLCDVEDLDGETYAWAGLDKKRLKEVVLQVDKITFGKEIVVRCTYRLIVADDKTQPRTMTKRKLEQQKKKFELQKRKADQSNQSNIQQEDRKGKVEEQANEVDPPSGENIQNLPGGHTSESDV